MDKVFSVGIVIGAALGKGYSSVFATSEQRVKKLGYDQANRKLGAAKALITYKKKLEQLKAKQVALGGSSRRLSAGVRELENRYRRAKREAKQYGITVGNVVAQHKKLEVSAKRLKSRLRDIDIGKRNKALRSELHSKALPIIGGAYAAGRVLRSGLDISEKAVRQARKHAVDFARRSLASEGEVLDIQYALNSARLRSMRERWDRRDWRRQRGWPYDADDHRQAGLLLARGV